MDEKTYESVLAIIENLWRDEKKHWQECGWPKNHIYRHVKQLADWADEVAKDYTTEITQQ